MDIANFIAKQILDYQQKIDDCQTLLNSTESTNRRLRRENASMDERHDILCEMKVLNAQLIAYGQMKVELNSIMQELGL